jgi:hypothetical protein
LYCSSCPSAWRAKTPRITLFRSARANQACDWRKKENEEKKSYQEIFLVIRKKSPHQQLFAQQSYTANMGKIKKKGMLIAPYSLRS